MNDHTIFLEPRTIIVQFDYRFINKMSVLLFLLVSFVSLGLLVSLLFNCCTTFSTIQKIFVRTKQSQTEKETV